MDDRSITEVEKEYLIDIINQEGIEVIMKVVDICISRLEDDVLESNPDNDKFGTVALKLARMQGAKKVQRELVGFLKEAKKKELQRG